MIDRYFAYGSNMNPARVAGRGLQVSGCKRARLNDVTLVFDKASSDHPGCAHANLAFARGRWVEGVLFQLAAPEEILKMDVFERAPINYSREIVVVRTEHGDATAWTYFGNPALRRPDLRPERAYLDHLLAARDYLSHEYFEWLRVMPCAGET